MRVYFSILVPVYNVEKYIDKCISSALNQTYKQWEMVLVDDGSTDKSGIIADEYAKQDKRIRVYHKQNEGLLRTRQYSVPLAKGDYCVFLDSDDYLSENALETILKSINNGDFDCIVYGYRRVINDGKIKETVTESSNYVVNEKNKNIMKLLCNSSYNSLCRKAVKTTILKKSYKEYEFVVTQAEDLLQSIDIYMNCNSVKYIQDVLYNYRDNLNSVSHTRNILKQQDDIYVVRSYVLRKTIDNNILNNQEYDKLRNYYIRIYVDIIRRLAENMEYLPFKRKAITYTYGGYYDFINTNNNYITNSKIYGILWELVKRKHYWILWNYIRLLRVIH